MKSVKAPKATEHNLKLARALTVQVARDQIRAQNLTIDELIEFAARLYATTREALVSKARAESKVDVLTKVLKQIAEARKLGQDDVAIIEKFTNIVSVGDTIFHETLALAEELPKILSQAHQEGDKERRVRVAEKGALGKLRKDPVQDDKRLIYKHWLEWQAGKSKYKGPTAFADAMLAKSEVESLKDRKSILDWHYDWKKGQNVPREIDDQ